MKKYIFILTGLTAGFLLGALGSNVAFADPIQAEHRVCEQSEDCSLIGLHCSCTSTCWNSKGHDVDAVNKNYIEQFKYLESCTASETKNCAEAGACAVLEIPSAVCQNRQCVVAWRPNPYINPNP